MEIDYRFIDIDKSVTDIDELPIFIDIDNSVYRYR